MNILRLAIIPAVVTISLPLTANADSMWHSTPGEAGWILVPEHFESTKNRADVLADVQLPARTAHGRFFSAAPHCPREARHHQRRANRSSQRCEPSRQKKSGHGLRSTAATRQGLLVPREWQPRRRPLLPFFYPPPNRPSHQRRSRSATSRVFRARSRPGPSSSSAQP